jgi:hypothetical protein
MTDKMTVRVLMQGASGKIARLARHLDSEALNKRRLSALLDDIVDAAETDKENPARDRALMMDTLGGAG